MVNTVADAHALAAAAHAGQLDKSGAPYIDHPMAVAGYARSLAALWGLDPDRAQIVGLFHDVIEDTTVTAQRLVDDGWDYETVADVQALTKTPGEPRAPQLAALCSRPYAWVVKWADNWHNSKPDRLEPLDAPTATRLATKYAEDRETLRGNMPHMPVPDVSGFVDGAVVGWHADFGCGARGYPTFVFWSPDRTVQVRCKQRLDGRWEFDEVVGPCRLHVETMSDSSVWIGVTGDGWSLAVDVSTVGPEFDGDPELRYLVRFDE